MFGLGKFFEDWDLFEVNAGGTDATVASGGPPSNYYGKVPALTLSIEIIVSRSRQ
jgi:hypothetical protein